MIDPDVPFEKEALFTKVMDEAGSRALAETLLPFLTRGDLVCLSGNLGSGKSTFARALIKAACRNPDTEVPSPTFTIVQTYDTAEGLEIWHTDLYRITDPQDIYELGLEEARESALVLAEWPSLLPDEWREEGLVVTFDHVAEKGLRRITVAGNRTWSERLGSSLEVGVPEIKQ